MMRDKIGSFMSVPMRIVPESLDHGLRDARRHASRHEGPLSAAEARIDVSEVPGKPGVYRAVAFLKPHFQLDELSVYGWLPMRLVADPDCPAKRRLTARAPREKRPRPVE
jgi:type VI secretion system protein ImpC